MISIYFFLQFFFPLVLLPISLYFFYHNSKFLNKNKLISIHFFNFIRNRHRFLDWITSVLLMSPTNTISISLPGRVQWIITANSLNVEHMTKTNCVNYTKGNRFQFFYEDFFGAAIYDLNPNLLKTLRNVVSRELNTTSLRSFVIDNTRLELHTRFIPLLSIVSQTNEMIDIQNLLERFSFETTCKMVFNKDLTCLGGDDGTLCSEEFLHAFKDVATLSAGRYLYALPLLWKLKRVFNIGKEKRLRESIKTVHEFIENIIKSRIQDNESGKGGVDLLSRFIVASDENLENSLQFLRDFCIGFILAGRDTYTVLVWFYWLLSSRPEIERNILEEIKAIRNSNGKCIGDNYDLAELRQMHYLHAAISEAMRLYPTPTINTKRSQEDDIMPDGTFVGKGWFVAYTAYGMGRMENLWGKDCNDFVPERWLDNGMFQPESPYKYSAFHSGPRMCLGKDLAYIQMKLIAASMIEKFKIEVVDKTICPEHLCLTNKMRDRLMVRVKERSMIVID